LLQAARPSTNRAATISLIGRIERVFLSGDWAVTVNARLERDSGLVVP
jgi:hypothetical protein